MMTSETTDAWFRSPYQPPAAEAVPDGRPRSWIERRLDFGPSKPESVPVHPVTAGRGAYRWLPNN